jgi:hypothetical protein
MLTYPLDEINETHLQNLIVSRTLERKTLEYKSLLPGNRDGEKKEFLADVSSFANSIGGDIIYGIRENEDHNPVELSGVNISDIDSEIRRIESIIRDGISPRIPNVSIKIITLQNGRYSVIIRIPNSWSKPHMVSFGGSSRFFARATNGKFQLDIGDIRAAFLLSDSKTQRIKEFVHSRVSDVYANNTPIPLTQYPKLIVHIIPISSLESPYCEKFNQISTIPMDPMCTGGGHRTYNSDGLLHYSHINEGQCDGYVQIYHNGIIEAVSSFISSSDRPEDQNILPIIYIENEIMGALKNYIKIYPILNIEPPAFIFIHLLGVKGLSIPRSSQFIHFNGNPIYKDLIYLPNFQLDKFRFTNSDEDNEFLTRILKLPFDTMANSVGLPYSLSYNQNGEFIRTI